MEQKQGTQKVGLIQNYALIIHRNNFKNFSSVDQQNQSLSKLE